MAAHTQFCRPGDCTYEATTAAVRAVASRGAATGAAIRLVLVISDADLARYGKQPAEWDRLLTAEPAVHAVAVLIASRAAEAQAIRDALSPGKVLPATNRPASPRLNKHRCRLIRNHDNHAQSLYPSDCSYIHGITMYLFCRGMSALTRRSLRRPSAGYSRQVLRAEQKSSTISLF